MSTNTEISSLPFLIATAHPTDTFDDGTAALLQDAAGASVVCVNAHASPRVQDAPTVRRLETMIDEIEAERHRRGHGRWVFWGMSGGGWLGQLYARKFPDALSGLILESVCPCFRVRLTDPTCILSPFNSTWRTALDTRGLIADGSHEQVGDPDVTEWIEIPEIGSVFRRTGGPALLVAPMPTAAENALELMSPASPPNDIGVQRWAPPEQSEEGRPAATTPCYPASRRRRPDRR